MNASVLIVEDDATIAQVVKSYLLEAGFVVFVADCGAEALRLAKQEHPDLVLLDLKLPDLPGEAVCRGIKEMGDIPVIMVTSKASEEERITGFALGADDYVVKPFSARELVFRVKAVLKRSESKVESSPQASFNSGKLVLETDDYRVTVSNSPALLTATEFKILHLMATRPGKVFTREELVDKALGYACEGYERCIDAHIKNIRHKIGDQPRNPVYIESVYGVGYRFNGIKDS